MDRTLAVRAISLYAPAMLVALGCALRPPGRRRAIAAVLGCAWSLPSLLLVNILAQRVGWWSFASESGAIASVPGDLLLGWMLLWGAVPVLLAPKTPLTAVVAALALLDVATMPLAVPVVRLGHHWLVGEVACIVVALVPAQLLARWTWRGRRVGVRAAMQAIVFSAVLLWIFPELILLNTAGSWAQLRHTWNLFGGMHLQLAMIPAVMGLSAVQEFAVRGQGTPLPFDPPKRLVTSGPYAYVANPMQLSMVLVLTCWGLIIGSGWMLLAGPISIAYSVGLAAWDEASDLGERFGAPWRSYRQHVRAWIPRLRPFHRSIDASIDSMGAAELDAEPLCPARLYVAASCGPCSEVAAWFAERSPRGLEIVPAELHPARDLERITYDAGDGSAEEEGLAALARALEHINLGWALLGWIVRLPVLCAVLQLIVDASGGAPRTVVRSASRASSDSETSAAACAR
jgi:protein-S-isoprenylcysteine O-methyltransferase Ste14